MRVRSGQVAVLIGAAVAIACGSTADNHPEPDAGRGGAVESGGTSAGGARSTGGHTAGGAANGGAGSSGGVPSGGAQNGGAGAADGGASGAGGAAATGGAGAGSGGTGGSTCGQCPPLTTCCRGACVDITSDPLHCGDCTIQCPRGLGFCNRGQCSAAACDLPGGCGIAACCGSTCCKEGQVCCNGDQPGQPPHCTDPVNGGCPATCPTCP